MATATFTPEVKPVEGKPASVTLVLSETEANELECILRTPLAPLAPRRGAVISRLHYILRQALQAASEAPDF